MAYSFTYYDYRAWPYSDNNSQCNGVHVLVVYTACKYEPCLSCRGLELMPLVSYMGFLKTFVAVDLDILANLWWRASKTRIGERRLIYGIQLDVLLSLSSELLWLAGPHTLVSPWRKVGKTRGWSENMYISNKMDVLRSSSFWNQKSILQHDNNLPPDLSSIGIMQIQLDLVQFGILFFQFLNLVVASPTDQHSTQKVLPQMHSWLILRRLL